VFVEKEEIDGPIPSNDPGSIIKRFYKKFFEEKTTKESNTIE
jgi:hypothetical protein